MSDTVIDVTGLGKRYFLAHQRRHDTLRDSLAGSLRAFARRLAGRESAPAGVEEFWALRDVSFQIARGDVVGIIGRNGAGKSTLLKVLSRITDPTCGSARIRGRVASLLEVGTGFHPELTGRENIFLNGAILGMSRAEIRARFDEIVAFAEVERFLDTQVKHYSSGMYVRLAFAVAAHLQPEILIVDEVLAVGDAQFQQKCLGKMRDVTSQGRTVLLVSHNMAVVQSLCSRVLLLESGRLVDHAEPATAIARYLAAGQAAQFERPLAPNARCAVTRGEVQVLDTAEGPRVQVNLSIGSRAARRLAVELRLHDAQGQLLAFGSLGTFEPGRLVAIAEGETRVSCSFPASHLANGRYSIGLQLTTPFVEILDQAPDALSFDLALPPEPGWSHRLLQSWNCGSLLLDLRADG